MPTDAPATGTNSFIVCEQQIPQHAARFAGTTVGSGFRYSVIRVIGGNMRAPMPVVPAVVNLERWLHDG